MAGTFAPNLTNPVAVVFSSNRQLSYFLGLNANDEQPNSILGGDRNLTTNGIPVTAGRLLVTADHALGFNKKIDP